MRQAYFDFDTAWVKRMARRFRGRPLQIIAVNGNAFKRHSRGKRRGSRAPGALPAEVVESSESAETGNEDTEEEDDLGT